VDEARIPPKGTLVRCSRCKATFIVKAEQPSFEETVQDVVAEVTEAGGQPVPAPSEDLFEQSPDDLGTTVRGPEEDSWEFDEEPPDHSQPPAGPAEEAQRPFTPSEPEPAFTEAAAAEPEVSFSESAAAEPEVSFSESAAAEPEVSFSESAAAEPENSFSEPAAAEPEISFSEPAAAELEASSEESDPLHAAFSDTKPTAAETDPLEPAPSVSASFEGAPEPSNPALDELGPPDDWDLLGDSSVDAAARGATFVEAPPEASVAGQEAPTDEAVESGTEPERQAASRTPSRERLSALAKRFIAAGRGAVQGLAWAGVVAALGAGMVTTLPHGTPTLDWSSTPALLPLADGEARDVQVRLVENAFAGTLYVVQGELVRLAADPLLGLRVQWRDAAGETLGTGVWAQSLPPNRALRERAPEAWHESRAGIAPAPARGAFAAIFTELPEGAVGVAASLERIPGAALPAEVGDPASEGSGTAQPEPSEAAATTPSSPSLRPSAG
jgi:hypothetical protein